jgi:1,4-dihydroxy-2-naphthoyl-CoA hydrolase
VANVGTWNLLDMEKEYTVGLEINANNIRGKSERIVKTTGFLIHKGKTTIVWDIKITDEQNDKLICIARCTMAVLKKLKKSPNF